MSVIRSAVTGVGSFLPEQVVTNDDLAKFVDTTDEWIVERTGIRKRHRARDDEPTSDLATEAARRALADAGKTAADVDMIIVATTTPDMTFPATASIVQRKIGAPVCIAFDVQAVCSGFVYALSVADGFVARGQGDGEANIEGAHVLGSAVSGFLDARPAAGGTEQVLFFRQGCTVFRDQLPEQAGLIVVAGVTHLPLGMRHSGSITGALGFFQHLECLIRCAKAGAAEYHNRVLDTERLLVEIRLEHFQLEPDAARLSAQQELGVGKGQAVSIGLQRNAGVGMGFEIGPCVGQRACIEVVRGFQVDALLSGFKRVSTA